MTNVGEISAELAKEHAENEYKNYRTKQDRLFKSDFDKNLESISNQISDK